jgi:hypothetical protein
MTTVCVMHTYVHKCDRQMTAVCVCFVNDMYISTLSQAWTRTLLNCHFIPTLFDIVIVYLRWYDVMKQHPSDGV